MNSNIKILIPGAAGLVGQNLIIQLKDRGYRNIVALDKHAENARILKELHPDITVIVADLSERGEWESAFDGADVVLMLQAQIGAPTIEPFIRNNIKSTEVILDLIKRFHIPYTVHISSSVVESVASDFYTNTKKEQERMVVESGIPHCVLRPTLMFGWFDRKHLGWLSRFMEKVPVFPIPGHGRYMRQPLYEKDFCNIIIRAMEMQPQNEIFNITGCEKIDYIDIIKTIKRVKNLKTPIVNIPYSMFKGMMSFYAMFSSNPPFTTQQLEALVADDVFELIPWWDIFGVQPTPFEEAMRETFTHPEYSKIQLKF